MKLNIANKVGREVEFWSKALKFLFGTSLGAAGIASIWGILGLKQGIILFILLGFFLVAGTVELYFNLRHLLGKKRN